MWEISFRYVTMTLMENLSPKSFFDISQFAHPGLFTECSHVWEALGKIKKYLQERTLGKIEIEVPKEVTLVHPELISIGKGTSIEAGAFIQGPCIIGEKCTIRHGAYLRGDVVMGNECLIGHATEIKHSILLNRAYAPHFNYIGDSILGNNVNLGAGFVCANYRLDSGEVRVYFHGEKIESGVNKFGIILGDGSHLGCNGVSNPGTLIGKGSVSYPCINFGGVFGPSSVISNQSDSVCCN